MSEPLSRSEVWLEQLQANGYRATGSRRAVVEIIASSGCVLSPMDVYERARQNYPSLGLVTVYRTIEYYIEAFPVEEEPGERELAQQRATSTLTEQAEKEIKVLGPDGGEVGQLKGVLMDPQGQTVQYGVVALNDRKNERDLCAVPWSELKENEEGNYQGNYTCAIPRQSMAESPKFTERELKNQARNRGIIDRIRSYYNRDSGQPSDKENQ